MLAALGVGLGREEASFGRYLGPAEPNADPETPAAPPTTLPRRERRAAILLRLFERPADGGILAALAETDYALAAEDGADQEIAAEANAALARARVRFAVDAVASGDLTAAESFLKQGVLKDPGLLDAWFLRAKVAAAVWPERRGVAESPRHAGSLGAACRAPLMGARRRRPRCDARGGEALRAWPVETKGASGFRVGSETLPSDLTRFLRRGGALERLGYGTSIRSS